MGRSRAEGSNGDGGKGEVSGSKTGLGERIGRRVGLTLPPPGPQRALILSSFANRVGNGVFNTAAVLYFVRIVHLGKTSVGLGLTVAGLVGLLAGIPVGRLADRRGPRTIMLITLAAQTATMVAFVFVRSWATFVAVAVLDMTALSANNAARGAVVARVGGEHPAVFRATLRAFVNLGVVIGTFGAAFALQIDTRPAYVAIILGNAVSYVVCGLLLLRVPNYTPHPRPKQQRRMVALADKPFVAFASLVGGMSLQYPVISVLLPIWITTNTHAPRWTVSAVAAANSLVCVVLQARIGSRVRTLREGGRALRVAGLFFLVSCPLMALSADVPTWAAVTVLLAAIIAHSLGEIWESSGGFTIGFGLAPDHAQGEYQGVIGTGFDLGQALGPAVLTGLLAGCGQAGWLLLAGFFAVLGLAGPAATGWGERTREPNAPVLARSVG
jgi:MFS family permease